MDGKKGITDSTTYVFFFFNFERTYRNAPRHQIGVLDTFKRKTSSQVKRRIVLTGMDDCQVTWDPMITSEVDYNTNEPPIFFLKNASKKEMLNVHLKAESVPKRDEWIESIMKIIKSKKEKEKQKEDSKSQEEGKKKESE